MASNAEYSSILRGRKWPRPRMPLFLSPRIILIINNILHRHRHLRQQERHSSRTIRGTYIIMSMSYSHRIPHASVMSAEAGARITVTQLDSRSLYIGIKLISPWLYAALVSLLILGRYCALRISLGITNLASSVTSRSIIAQLAMTVMKMAFCRDIIKNAFREDNIWSSVLGRRHLIIRNSRRRTFF